MKKLIFALVMIAGAVQAQKVIPLYPGPAPGSETWDWKEKESTDNPWKTRLVYNVTKPTITVYPADPAVNTGAAVIVCPGGAFHILSIDSEGIEVAKALNKKGITAFVLKYRLVRLQTDDPATEVGTKMMDTKKLDQDNAPVVVMAIADGKKAIEYARQHAAEYKINPQRIGIMGFSAGGTVTMGVGFNYSPENRPDFLAPIYFYRNALGDVKVPSDAPPVFICAASDDQLGFASHSVNLYTDWTTAGKSAELHLYNKGGHGFGMRKQDLPTDQWIDRFTDWLGQQGFLKSQAVVK